MSTEKPARVRCSYCNKVLSVPAALRGKKVSCPNPACKKSVTVPVLAAPTPGAVSAPRPEESVRPMPFAEPLSGPRPSSRGRRWLILAGTACGALLLLVLAGVTFFVGDASGKKGDTSPAAVLEGPELELDSPGAGQSGIAKLDIAKLDIVKPIEVKPDVELPPVGPTPQPPADPVVGKFKAARVTYLKARRLALSSTRLQCLAAVRKEQDEIRKSNVNAETKAQALRQLDLAASQFASQYRYIENFNVLPVHPSLQGFVAGYWRTLNDAAQKFAAVAEEGLTVYEKAGLTDAARQQPLLAARAAAQHANLLGVWTSKDAKTNASNTPDYKQTWVIDFDERTGGLQIAGMEHNATFRGENVECKDGVLTFDAVRVDQRKSAFGSVGAPNTVTLEFVPNANLKGESFSYVGTGSAPRTMTLADGKLSYELRAVPWQKIVPAKVKGKIPNPPKALPPKAVAVILDHLNDEVGRDLVARSLKAAGHNATALALNHKAPERPTDKLDVRDANAAWRQLAALSSFAWSVGPDTRWQDQLYLPFRSNNPIKPTGLLGKGFDTLLQMHAGKTAGADQDPIQKLLSEYEAIAGSPHPYLKRANEQALACCRTRLRLALANDEFGNTPDSQIRVFQQTVFMPVVQYQLQREADIAAVRESLESQFPGYRVVVADAPLSAESRQKLKEVLSGVGNFKENIQQRAVVSGLLAYADMAQVDRNVAFWQTWLMPLAKRCSGPASDKPIVEITQAGYGLGLRNIAEQDLTHVVVEAFAENEWGDRAAHYYYIPQLEVAEFHLLYSHPRWVNRRLPFTNSLTVNWSVWADQGCNTSRQSKLIAPAPKSESETTRKKFLDYDKQYQAEGEALGAVVQSMIPLPAGPAWLKGRLRAASAPGTSYIFRVAGADESARTLVLRFLRFDEGPAGIEAEVLDAKTRKPFHASTPVWKGRLEPNQGATISFGAAADGKQPDWVFGFGGDDGLLIECPSAGAPGAAFPVRNIPLLAVKTP